VISGFFPVFSQDGRFPGSGGLFKILDFGNFAKRLRKDSRLHFLEKISRLSPSRIFDFSSGFAGFFQKQNFSSKKTLRLDSDGLAQDSHLIPF